MALPTDAYAVMISTARSSSIRFSSSSVATPSIPGIMMSTIAASNGIARASSRPSSPEDASRTVYPSRVSSVSRISRMISSSSTTRIMPVPVVAINVLPTLPAGARSPDFGGARQRQREARALADHAIAVNLTVVFPHDAVRNRQSESGPPADRLGREERVVDPRQVFGRNTGAGIRNLGHHPAVLDARGHQQPAAARHRIAGVQKQ